MESNVDLTYRTYQPEAKAQARRLRPRQNQVDLLGLDQEDYIQEFTAHAARAAFIFQEKFGFCAPAEQRYTKTALCRVRTNWARSHSRISTVFSGVMLDIDGHEDALSYTEEGKFEARSLLRYLDRTLDSKDRQLFCRLVEAGGSIEKAWEADSDYPSLGGFKRRVSRLRKKAKRLIEKSSKKW